MRLKIGVLSTKEFLGTLDANIFNFIDFFATTVVTLAWITFSVLI